MLRAVAGALVLSHASIGFAGTASASVTITVTVTPTSAQVLEAAQISVHRPDGTTVLLDRQQQARYIEDPDSIARGVRASAGDPLRVTIRY